MHRFFAASASGDLLTLEEADAYHAFRVLRLTPGTEITVFYGENAYLCPHKTL